MQLQMCSPYPSVAGLFQGTWCLQLHVFLWVRISFPKAHKYFFVPMDRILFNSSSIHEHPGCSHLWLLKYSSSECGCAKSACVYSFGDTHSTGVAGSYGESVCRNSALFSIAAAPFCGPASRAPGPHILAHTAYCCVLYTLERNPGHRVVGNMPVPSSPLVVLCEVRFLEMLFLLDSSLPERCILKSRTHCDS